VTASTPPPTGVEQRLDTIIHLLTAIITKDMGRKEAVLMLTAAGLAPIAVAGLLGLKQNQVNVVLYDARQAAKKAKAPKNAKATGKA
jgi:hypothetical protein